LYEMAEQVEAAFADHYMRTSDQPDDMESMAIRYCELDWTRHGEPIGEAIQMAAMIDEPPASAIAEILAERHDTFVPGDVIEEREFDPESYYERLDSVEDDHFHRDWERFEQSLKSEARFFRRKAEQVLSDIFSGVTEARTKSGDSVIISAGPGSALSSVYRARVFQSRGRLEVALSRPDLEIAPPPSKHARAGRMNARGVPVFYGATEARIAMAEVRPPVGADGRFGDLWTEEGEDGRAVSLRLDPDSLVVHRINAVRFSTTEMPVNRKGSRVAGARPKGREWKGRLNCGLKSGGHPNFLAPTRSENCQIANVEPGEEIIRAGWVFETINEDEGHRRCRVGD
jgi:RES domain